LTGLAEIIDGRDPVSGKRGLEDWAFFFLVGFAFCSGFSMPVGRILLGISLVLAVICHVKVRKGPVLPLSFWFWLLFAAVAALSTSYGVDPVKGFGNMDKLIWFAGIPACAILVTSTSRLTRIVGAYAVGTGVEAIRTIVWHPVKAMRAVSAGRQPDFLSGLVDAGAMTYAQVLMLGLLISLGFIFISRKEGRSTLMWWVLLVLQAVALVMMFKRGSWVCAFFLVAVFLCVKTNWRYLLVLLLVVAASLALPPVRARIAGLQQETDIRKGGRMTMWFKITPALWKENPWLGKGYRVLTPEMMARVTRRVEPNRNHLHSNIAQILVETGVVGLFVYVMWMAVSIGQAVVVARRTAGRAGPEHVMALVLLLMLVGLIGNGLVEYNFGDGELILVYGMIMWCVGAARRVLSSSPDLRSFTAVNG
jgi:O-antigen ligase